MKTELSKTMHPLYIMAVIGYVICYVIAAVIVTLYVIKFQAILLGILAAPLILFRISAVLFASLGSNNPTAYCYTCTVYASVTIAGIQSGLLALITVLQSFEVDPTNLIVTLFTALEFIWCYYVLAAPLYPQTTTTPYILVPNEMYIRPNYAN